MTHRRFKKIIGIRYDDASKVIKIVKEIDEMLKTFPNVDYSSGGSCVFFVNFGESSLDIQVRAFTKQTGYIKFNEFSSALMLKIYDIIVSNGADCAYPTRTVILQKDEQDLPGAL